MIYALNLIIFSAAFWAIYQLLLKRDTFFTANRVYLLVAPVLALVLPLLSFEFFQFGTAETPIFQLPVAELGKLTIAPETAERTTAATSQPFSLFQILIGIYAVGVLVSLGLFLLKLRNLQKLRKTGKRVPLENHGVSLGNRKAFIIEIPNSKIAFSFFNTIFLGDHYSETEKQQIAKHERVHMKQKHSWDLVFFEFLRIVLWFNPFVYVFQKDITETHEFLADEKTAENQSKKTYAESLLNAGFGTRQLSFTNSFFTQNSLKTRLVMLYRSKSNPLSSLKFLVVAPLIFLMMTYTSCFAQDSNLNETKKSSNDIRVVSLNDIGDSLGMKKLKVFRKKALGFEVISTDEIKLDSLENYAINKAFSPELLSTKAVKKALNSSLNKSNDQGVKVLNIDGKTIHANVYSKKEVKEYLRKLKKENKK